MLDARSRSPGGRDVRRDFGNITELASGYPGYDSEWPKDSVSIAEGLKQNAPPLSIHWTRVSLVIG